VGAIVLILLPLRWVDISGNKNKPTIRKHFFGKRKEVAFEHIKRARIFKENSRGRITKFLGVDLKSGKSFDLFLPRKKQAELVAFIKCRTKS
jgi:hypothetical protein